MLLLRSFLFVDLTATLTAAAAFGSLKRAKIGDNVISVRFCLPEEEPSQANGAGADVDVSEYASHLQHVRLTASRNAAQDSDDSGSFATAEEETPESEESAEAKTARDAATAKYRLEEAQRQYDEAVVAERDASREREAALEKKAASVQAYATAKRARAGADFNVQVLAKACEEAKRRWHAIVTQEDRARREAADAEVNVAQAREAEDSAAAQVARAQQEQARLGGLKEEAGRVLQEAIAAEKAVQKERLREIMKRMEEIHIQEERDRPEREARAREEKHRQDTIDAAERENREKQRMEKERMEREQKRVRDAEDRSQREHEQAERERLRDAYDEASAAERERCRRRDEGIWHLLLASEMDRCVKWLEQAGKDFDSTKFSRACPLTFESVPWPVCRRGQRHCDLEDITWDAVKKFFDRLKSHLRSLGREEHYHDLLQATQRRFHPDKWSARGLLKTVFDDALRERLADLGVIVSQEATELWSKSKG